MTESSDPISESAPETDPAEAAAESSRRAFLSANLKRAAYVAPIVWSVSAREAHASQISGLSGPPTPE